MKKVTYLSVIEPGKDGFGIFFPDLPGCTSLASSIEEAFEKAKEALEFHYYGLSKPKDEIPEPSKTLAEKKHINYSQLLENAILEYLDVKR